MRSLILAVLMVCATSAIADDKVSDEKLPNTKVTEKESQEKEVPAKEVPLHETPIIQEMLAKNNELRKANGLSAHKISPELTAFAQRHAVWMATTGNYMHSNLFVKDYPGFVSGEIIFCAPRTVAEAFAGWRASPAHNAIMMSGAIEAGFGRAVAPNGTIFWIGIYGVPRQ